MNSHYPNISNYPNTLLFEHVLLQRRRYVRSYMIQFKFNSGRHLHNVLTLSIHERVLPTVTINTIVLPGWSPSLNLYDSSSVEIKDARQTHQTIEKMFNFQTIYKYIYIYIFLLNKVDKFFESLHYIYIYRLSEEAWLSFNRKMGGALVLLVFAPDGRKVESPSHRLPDKTGRCISENGRTCAVQVTLET